MACQLVRLSTCQCPSPLREASVCYPSLGQNLLACLDQRRQQQSSNKVVKGQELLRVLWNSLPLSHLSHTASMATRVAQQVASAFGGLVVFVVCLGVLFSLLVATCIATLSSLEQGDLCRTCAHSASTRAKKKQARVRCVKFSRDPLRRSCVPSAGNAAEQAVEVEAENWRLCSTTLVRGVAGELEAENFSRGPICGAGS